MKIRNSEFGIRNSILINFILCILFLCAPAFAMNTEQEIRLGEETAKAIEQQYGVLPDEEVQARVDRIGQKLAAHSLRKDMPFHFKVLNCDEVNALAIPGGRVYVFRGLLDFMPTDDELAGVMGHEIGHIEKRHIISQMKQQQNMAILALLAAVVAKDPMAGMALGTTVSQALLAGYSRRDEREADDEGFRLAMAAGYNPYCVYVTMSKLYDLSVKEGNPGYGLFSSHPEPEVRMKKNLKLLEPYKIKPTVSLDKEGNATVTDGEWSFTIMENIGFEKADYRAHLMAGALWRVRQRGKVDESRFISIDNELTSDIYYEDIHILRVYGADALKAASVSEYALQVLDKLQKWGGRP